jgi:hypothetical protein
MYDEEPCEIQSQLRQFESARARTHCLYPNRAYNPPPKSALGVLLHFVPERRYPLQSCHFLRAPEGDQVRRFNLSPRLLPALSFGLARCCSGRSLGFQRWARKTSKGTRVTIQPPVGGSKCAPWRREPNSKTRCCVRKDLLKRGSLKASRVGLRRRICRWKHCS